MDYLYTLQCIRESTPDFVNMIFYLISEDVLKECADSVLGKWMVAKIDKFTGDATTHTPEEVIVGQIPLNQEVEFVKDDDDYLRAYALAVISKVYAKDYCDIFENGIVHIIAVLRFNLHFHRNSTFVIIFKNITIIFCVNL